MNKSILFLATLVLLVCTFNTPCSAQKDRGSNGSQIGIKGGVNFSDLYTENADNSKMITGFNIGVFSKLQISDNFAFQPELYFTTKGAEVTYNNAFVNGTARFRLDYLEIPLLLVVNVTDNFNIHVGPYAAYLLSGTVKNQSNVTLFNFEDNIDTRDYNRLDAGIAAGAGFDFRSVSFGARFNYGLTKVGKDKTYDGTTYRFPDGNNGVLSFYMSVPLHEN